MSSAQFRRGWPSANAFLSSSAGGSGPSPLPTTIRNSSRGLGEDHRRLKEHRHPIKTVQGSATSTQDHTPNRRSYQHSLRQRDHQRHLKARPLLLCCPRRTSSRTRGTLTGAPRAWIAAWALRRRRRDRGRLHRSDDMTKAADGMVVTGDDDAPAGAARRRTGHARIPRAIVRRAGPSCRPPGLSAAIAAAEAGIGDRAGRAQCDRRPHETPRRFPRRYRRPTHSSASAPTFACSAAAPDRDRGDRLGRLRPTRSPHWSVAPRSLATRLTIAPGADDARSDCPVGTLPGEPPRCRHSSARDGSAPASAC